MTPPYSLKLNFDNPYFRGMVMPWVFAGKALPRKLCKDLGKLAVKPWEESPDGKVAYRYRESTL